MASVASLGIRRYESGIVRQMDDELAVEEPLELQLSYGASHAPIRQTVSVTMRTPGNDASLGAGFLFTEGILSSPTQVNEIVLEAGGENTVLVRLSEGCQPVLHKAERNFYTTSSCGVCGKASIDAIRTVSPFSTDDSEMAIPVAILQGMPAELRKQQAVFNTTGGLHASALFTPDGQFVGLQEDVGRHNALDKLIGDAFLEDRLPLRNHILLLSGRASFELVQKAAMAGIPVIAAIGAPSSLAVSLAQEQHITLVGFLREDRFNIYTHPQRISI